MNNNTLVITIHLNLIIKRFEQLICEKTNYDIEEQLKIINDKIYEISDAIETIEVMKECECVQFKSVYE